MVVICSIRYKSSQRNELVRNLGTAENAIQAFYHCLEGKPVGSEEAKCYCFLYQLKQVHFLQFFTLCLPNSVFDSQVHFQHNSQPLFSFSFLLPQRLYFHLPLYFQFHYPIFFQFRLPILFHPYIISLTKSPRIAGIDTFPIPAKYPVVTSFYSVGIWNP